LEYTSKDIRTIFNLTTSRLHQLRSGYRQKSIKKGKEYFYDIPPVIIEGEDWNFVRGNIVYYKSAIDKLKKYSKSK
jgi:hypothetical protein